MSKLTWGIDKAHLSTIKCRLTINVSCKLLWLRRRSGNTKTGIIHQNWKLTPKQRLIKHSEPFRSGDDWILTLLHYILFSDYSLFDYLTLLNSVRWSYLLFDERNICSVNLCLELELIKRKISFPPPFFLRFSPNPQKRNARLIIVKGAVVIPWYAFFLSEIHILYTDIIFVKGWPVTIRRYFIKYINN